MSITAQRRCPRAPSRTRRMRPREIANRRYRSSRRAARRCPRVCDDGRRARLRGEIASDAAARVAARAAAGGSHPLAGCDPAGGCEVAVDAGDARTRRNPTGPRCSHAARCSAARGDRKTGRHASRPACWIGPYRPSDARQPTHGGHRRRPTAWATARMTSAASRRAKSGHHQPPARAPMCSPCEGALRDHMRATTWPTHGRHDGRYTGRRGAPTSGHEDAPLRVGRRSPRRDRFSSTWRTTMTRPP
jgi:hypothetical protein